MKHKKTIVIAVMLVLVALITGCNSPYPKYETDTFSDTGSMVGNEMKCQEICDNREKCRTQGLEKWCYKCAREEVKCENGLCVCITY